jgi:methyl-accepting chemotaxis protein
MTMRFRPTLTRISIRGSFFLAFAVIAGMAVLISAGAFLMLGQLGHVTDELSSRDIPRLTASLQLENQSTGLSAEAPGLLTSETETVLQERSKSMIELQRTASIKLGQIADLGGDKTVVAAMKETVGDIDQMITRLGSAAKERMDAAAQREERYRLLQETHRALVDLAMPAMLAAQAQVKAALATASSADGEIASATRTAEQLSNVIADGNLLAADLMAAISASTAVSLDSVQKRFGAVQARLKSSLGAMDESGAGSKIKQAALKLMALGVGKAGIFEIRQKELDANDFGQLVLDETRKFNIGLAVSVKKLVEDVQAETDAASLRAHQKILFATALMMGLGALTIAGSVLFVWLYVGRNVLRRIGGIQHAMQRLSDGDLEAEIEYASAADEVGIMARSLNVFRDSMIRARSLSAEQELDRTAKAERTARIEARIISFEEAIQTALESLTTSANTMQTTAQCMSESADQSNALVRSVASAAEKASVNVQTVSSNTEQLSSSISEISQQVATSAEITNNAVAQANSTDTAMQRLTNGASRISDIVTLIQSIASQTNLLALNATIEAARAGNAGKGFAVVASEVKMLADQTAKATDQVRPQITEMQQVTVSAVDAIRSIGRTIGNINEVASAIAAAVEQQGAATHEIARNIQYAAGGTREVSTHIIGVSQASEDARSAAMSVLEASNGLRRKSQLLRSEIDAFLVSIREA